MPILGVIDSGKSGHLFTLQGSYDALASVTVPSGGVSSVTFAGIPTGYSHLQIRYIAKNNRTSSALGYSAVQFNSDTGSNYAWHDIYGQGSSAGTDANASQTSMLLGLSSGASGNANCFGAGVIDILDYATNKNKTCRSLSGYDQNSNDANGQIRFLSGLWLSTNAINSITIADSSYAWQQYSSFALYGVK
jgi:hypothetical protein